MGSIGKTLSAMRFDVLNICQALEGENNGHEPCGALGLASLQFRTLRALQQRSRNVGNAATTFAKIIKTCPLHDP